MGLIEVRNGRQDVNFSTRHGETEADPRLRASGGADQSNRMTEPYTKVRLGAALDWPAFSPVP